MKSEIFHSTTYEKVESEIRDFLNGYPDFLSEATVSSPRATGDAIQNILQDNFQDILGELCKEYSADFARRAMADLAFADPTGLYYIVDVKTHRLETGFHMPNLTSVRRLARFYEDDSNYFVMLMVAYSIASSVRVDVERVLFVPIEFLSWDCLTIGALGWGQIQIADANNIAVNHGYSRKQWMLELCDTLAEFYPSEIEKIRHRLEYFKEVRKRWEGKQDIWK